MHKSNFNLVIPHDSDKVQNSAINLKCEECVCCTTFDGTVCRPKRYLNLRKRGGRYPQKLGKEKAANACVRQATSADAVTETTMDAECKTLWMGDIQMHWDETFISSLFAASGTCVVPVAPSFLFLFFLFSLLCVCA